jgi:transcriptional regulator with XRE-family HTH domain
MTDIARSDDADRSEPELLGKRLRDARESLGLPQSTVADHLEIPRTAVSEIEAGRRKVTFLELKRLAALYRRPIGFFSDDEPVSEDDTTTALYRTTAELSSTDRQQVLRFAQFLRDAGPAQPPARARKSQA